MTTIAIIGTGNVGSAIGAGAVKAGYDVVFAGQDAGQGRVRRRGRGRDRPRPRPARPSRGADIVVLAVPYTAVADVARGDRAGRRGQDRHRPDQPAQGRTTRASPPPRARRARSRSPPSCRDAKVVKAFNTLFATNTADPTAHGTQLDSLFATDDEAAKDAVCGLSGSIGFRPVHVGPLAASRELEAMAWLNIRMQMLTGGHWNTAFVMVDPPEAALTYGR